MSQATCRACSLISLFGPLFAWRLFGLDLNRKKAVFKASHLMPKGETEKTYVANVTVRFPSVFVLIAAIRNLTTALP